MTTRGLIIARWERHRAKKLSYHSVPHTQLGTHSYVCEIRFDFLLVLGTDGYLDEIRH